jgi:hypothetical protein
LSFEQLAAELYRDNEQTVKAAATLMTGAKYDSYSISIRHFG